jgi:hypothetical protein
MNIDSTTQMSSQPQVRAHLLYFCTRRQAILCKHVDIVFLHDGELQEDSRTGISLDDDFHLRTLIAFIYSRIQYNPVVVSRWRRQASSYANTCRCALTRNTNIRTYEIHSCTKLPCETKSLSNTADEYYYTITEELTFSTQL